MSLNKITEFTTKKGRVVGIWYPHKNDLTELLKFANRLVAEDTFLMFGPDQIKIKDEEKWLEAKLKNIENKQEIYILAKFNNQIIASCDIVKDRTRKAHIGSVGLMVDQDFRDEGIASKLLDFVLEKGPQIGIKIAILGVFVNNPPALHLYQKFGFQEYGRLPKALLWRDKYYDEIKMYKEIQPSFAKATEDK